jgi:hypothetical protein
MQGVGVHVSNQLNLIGAPLCSSSEKSVQPELSPSKLPFSDVQSLCSFLFDLSFADIAKTSFKASDGVVGGVSCYERYYRLSN